MLEEAIVLERDTANATEDGTFHELVSVRAETINDVVIIPDIDLRNRSVGRRKRFSAIPADVIVEVVLVAILTHLVVEWKDTTFVRVGDLCPGFEWAIHSNAIIVNLVTPSDHDMKGTFLVGAQDVIPEGRTL